jgi:hypothetical protein
MCSSCADILLFAAFKWAASRPSLLTDTNDAFDQVRDLSDCDGRGGGGVD